jgi:uncharacterized protein YecE (DUF72 family)
MARAWIGTSGYSYEHWSGPFYPRNLPESRWFEHYAGQFDAVELNVTFYRLPLESAFEGWARRAPRGFRFVIKGSRYITHVKRLQAGREAVETLFDRVEALGDRLACVLWQLPPRFRARPDRLAGFLRDLAACDAARRARHAFEFRDPSWFRPEIHEILRRANAAIVLSDHPFEVLAPGMRSRGLGRPVIRVPDTARFAYLRRHGPGALYGSSYPERMLRADARWVKRRLAAGRDAFVFYNNDARGYAVANATRLEEMVCGKRAMEARRRTRQGPDVRPRRPGRIR